MSDTDVGDELTVVGQVTRGAAGQGPVDESRYLEHDALPHMKPVQLAEQVRDTRCLRQPVLTVGCIYASDISVTETEIIDRALTETETMLIYETEII